MELKESFFDKNTELVNFFESRGYTSPKKADFKCFNNILFAERNGQECFIKKFQTWHHVKENGWERANNELACYANLPKDILIDVIEINSNEHYVVLKKEDLQDLEINEDYIAIGLGLGLEKFPQIDASFLPTTTWEYYEELCEKIKGIGEAGLIDNADAVIELFQSNKELIENSKKVFSHQDFSFRNIKKADNAIKVFDFEFSRRDNAMCDMATLFYDVMNDVELADSFKAKMSESELYNETLFNLMFLRRAIFIVSSFLSKQVEMNEYVRKNLEILRETPRKILSGKA